MPALTSSACAMQRSWRAAGSALRTSGLWHTQRKWATMQTRGAKSVSRAGGGGQFSRQKVSDLKEVLRAAGAQVSGTKSELQARIESICNENPGVSMAERLRLSGLKTAAVGPKGSSHSDTMLKSALDKAKSIIQRTRPDIAALAANTEEGQVEDDLADQPGLHAEDDARARAQEQPKDQEQAGAHSDVQCDDDVGGSYFRDSSGPSRPVEPRAPASDDWDSLVINAQTSEGMSSWDRSNDMGGNAPPQKTGSRTEILPPLFELSKLTPQERKRLVDKVLHSQMRSLYRRCLRSAEACPSENWQQQMAAYVKMRFRDHSLSGASRAQLIASGEEELSQMETYHDARRKGEAQQISGGGGGGGSLSRVDRDFEV